MSDDQETNGAVSDGTSLAEIPAELRPAVRDYLLCFADDEHLMGQHHTEWIGVAPFLEEDLALSSIGQDELGHAVMLYEMVLELDGIEATDTAVDNLAFRRDGANYRSSALVEYPATDWAETLVRHWMYDLVEELRWELVSESTVGRLRETAARAGREERYHRRHADAVISTLLNTANGHDRVLAALEPVIPLLPSLIAVTEFEEEIVKAGIASATLSSTAPHIAASIAARFDVATPELTTGQGGEPRKTRSDAFAPLMERMLEVLDYDPQATW